MPKVNHCVLAKGKGTQCFTRPDQILVSIQPAGAQDTVAVNPSDSAVQDSNSQNPNPENQPNPLNSAEANPDSSPAAYQTDPADIELENETGEQEFSQDQ